MKMKNGFQNSYKFTKNCDSKMDCINDYNLSISTVYI